jgi:signal transduction histidine kinase
MRPFRPPGSLLAILFCVTLVAVSALGWFGWKLLDQERAVEAQRAHERLEQTADGIAANAREALAEAPPAGGQPAEGVLLTIAGNNIDAAPAGRLLFRPIAADETDASADAFAEAEALEFQQAEPGRALEWYRRLAESKPPALRAGALVRMARVLRKTGRKEEAAQAYRQLARSGSTPVAGVPAELVARHALCELSTRREDAAALKRDLTDARWQLTRGQFAFYWSEASRLSADSTPAPVEPAALSEALARGWGDLMRDDSPRGLKTIWVENRPILLIWRSAPGGRAVLATRPESLFRRVFSGDSSEDFSCAAVDGEGRVVAGRRDGPSKTTPRATVRTMAETQLPWTLYVTAKPGPSEAGMAARQRFLALITVFMSLFLIGGAYFIAHAIRRDREVSRMQSDFVSAVSHEFRTPLTSIRQLSEMLALGRVPAEGRRQVYYETLVRESTRLERLVEGLLNFGRMEAGAGPYRFDEVEVSALAAGVAAEFEPQIAGQGRRIEFEGAAEGCRIHADAEALAVALRNLVDNALKYSPDSPSVQVAWRRKESRVAIEVKDEGLGIAAAERKAIFGKFIRGSAAAQANVKGSGVGLAMVRHIVEAHGGDITLASEPGRGSTFTMLLPASRMRGRWHEYW